MDPVGVEAKGIEINIVEAHTVFSGRVLQPRWFIAWLRIRVYPYWY